MLVPALKDLPDTVRFKTESPRLAILEARRRMLRKVDGPSPQACVPSDRHWARGKCPVIWCAVAAPGITQRGYALCIFAERRLVGDRVEEVQDVRREARSES